ncbi:MAG: hypothetical protein PF690_06735 [Deltaproteobacteria bacterium]|jgi:hypothetical protein|nr:hypothetical protein [Deltaproteobacteria bacterium]
MDFLNKIPNWLRWVLSLPIALLALFISYPLIIILNKITMIGIGEGFLTNLVILLLANLWSAAAFIWVGAIITPRHNFIVAVIFAVFYSFILGASFFAKFSLGSKSSITWLEMTITVIAGLVAAVGVVYHFYENETKVKTHIESYDSELY